MSISLRVVLWLVRMIAFCSWLSSLYELPWIRLLIHKRPLNAIHSRCENVHEQGIGKLSKVPWKLLMFIEKQLLWAPGLSFIACLVQPFNLLPSVLRCCETPRDVWRMGGAQSVDAENEDWHRPASPSYGCFNLSFKSGQHPNSPKWSDMGMAREYLQLPFFEMYMIRDVVFPHLASRVDTQ